MQRARILVLGLLALFFYPGISFSYDDETGAGQCISFPDGVVRCHVPGANDLNPTYTFACNDGRGAIISGGLTAYSYSQNTVDYNGRQVPYRGSACFWDSMTDCRMMYRYCRSYDVTGSTTPTWPSAGPCDPKDDDADGVCNSCDKKPGEPDPKDCIYISSKNSKGQTVDMVINEGCNSATSDFKEYRNESNAQSGGEGRTYFDIGSGPDPQINPKTCDANTPADENGQCGCAYPDGSGMSGFAAVGSGSPGSEIEDLKDDLNGLAGAKDCSTFQAKCDAACAANGGTKNNSCTKNPNTGQISSSCTCNGVLAYDAKNDGREDTNPPDANGNGIPDNMESGKTGGPDSNSDGIDDIGAAVRGGVRAGIDDSGLPGIARDIRSGISVLGNGIDRLGGKLDGIGEGVGGLGDKLDGIADKLEKGSEITGNGIVPDGNEYDSTVEEVPEDKLSDAIKNFIASGLPFSDFIRGSHLTVDSAVSTISGTIFGNTVTIDFSGLESTYHFMGLVLLSICTVIAFFIIIRRG